MLYTGSSASTIGKLRREIGDTSDTPTYNDDLLFGYISDAIDELELGEYKRGVSAVKGKFVLAGGQAAPVTNAQEAIYALKAAILLTTAIKSTADRENFQLKKNKLTVDTTGQSKNHNDTLADLNDRLRKAIYRAYASNGARIENSFSKQM